MTDIGRFPICELPEPDAIIMSEEPGEEDLSSDIEIMDTFDTFETVPDDPFSLYSSFNSVQGSGNSAQDSGAVEVSAAAVVAGLSPAVAQLQRLVKGPQRTEKFWIALYTLIQSQAVGPQDFGDLFHQMGISFDDEKVLDEASVGTRRAKLTAIQAMKRLGRDAISKAKQGERAATQRQVAPYLAKLSACEVALVERLGQDPHFTSLHRLLLAEARADLAHDYVAAHETMWEPGQQPKHFEAAVAAWRELDHALNTEERNDIFRYRGAARPEQWVREHYWSLFADLFDRYARNRQWREANALLATENPNRLAGNEAFGYTLRKARVLAAYGSDPRAIRATMEKAFHQADLLAGSGHELTHAMAQISRIFLGPQPAEMYLDTPSIVLRNAETLLGPEAFDWLAAAPSLSWDPDSRSAKEQLEKAWRDVIPTGDLYDSGTWDQNGWDIVSKAAAHWLMQERSPEAQRALWQRFIALESAIMASNNAQRQAGDGVTMPEHFLLLCAVFHPEVEAQHLDASQVIRVLGGRIEERAAELRLPGYVRSAGGAEIARARARSQLERLLQGL